MLCVGCGDMDLPDWRRGPVYRLLEGVNRLRHPRERWPYWLVARVERG